MKKEPQAKGKRERRKLATRSELIQAGRRLFSDRGLYESRIEDLTTEAGIAKGTLYTYFSDKDELIREVAAAGFGELHARVAQRIASARSRKDVAREAILAHLQFFTGNQDLMRVLHQVRGMLKFDRAEWRPLRATMNGYLRSLGRVLTADPRIERLDERDRLELARILFGAISGVTSVHAAGRSQVDLRSTEDAVVDGLEAMVSAFVTARAHASGSRKRPLRSGLRTRERGHVR